MWSIKKIKEGRKELNDRTMVKKRGKILGWKEFEGGGGEREEDWTWIMFTAVEQLLGVKIWWENVCVCMCVYIWIGVCMIDVFFWIGHEKKFFFPFLQLISANIVIVKIKDEWMNIGWWRAKKISMRMLEIFFSSLPFFLPVILRLSKNVQKPKKKKGKKFLLFIHIYIYGFFSFFLLIRSFVFTFMLQSNW